MTKIHLNSEGIKAEGHKGKWYVIGEDWYKGQKVYLVEHETYGEDAPALILDEEGKIIMEDVHDGFQDLHELDDNL